MNTKLTWDLKNYFYNSIDDTTLINDLNSIKNQIQVFITKYKGKISELKPDLMVTFLAKKSEINFLINKIGMYLYLSSSLDSQNQEILKKLGEFELQMTDYGNQLLFISQEFKAIGYVKLVELSKQTELSDYKHYFENYAENIKYLLEEKTEFALNLKDISGSSALNKIYEELTGSFVFKVEIDGEEKEVTESEVRSMRMSPKEEVRKAAYKSIRDVYSNKANQIVLGNVYNAVVKDWTNEIKIRGYDGILSQRNISEEMPDKAIEMLISEVQKHYPLYQKYLKIKLGLLNKLNGTSDTKLKLHNIFAPIQSIHKEIPFDKGVEIYLDTAKKFDIEMYNFSLDMLEKGRIDVMPSKGKSSGAYCYSLKNLPSFVFLNYTNKLDDVSTLAHELGHGFHGYLSQKQKEQVYSCSLCLAETASIFNEMLLSKEVVKTLETKEEKISYLSEDIQGVLSTIFNQIMYVSFEQEVHKNIASGKDLGYQDFNKIWRKHQKLLFGDIIEFDVEEDNESTWSAIPHIFHTPFYCYSYSFGNILTFSLYNKYQEIGSDFVPLYKNILSAGGSKSPKDLLLENGLDIENKKFYEDGLLVISQMIDELETLAN